VKFKTMTLRRSTLVGGREPGGSAYQSRHMKSDVEVTIELEDGDDPTVCADKLRGEVDRQLLNILAGPDETSELVKQVQDQATRDRQRLLDRFNLKPA
jgi:hypothetical protein